MNILLFLFLAALLAGCSTAQKLPEKAQNLPEKMGAPSSVSSDPIDQLVARLSSGDMWQNGLYLPIKLPPSAPIEDVLAQIYEKEHFYQSGKVGAYQVIEIRKVFNNHYTAVLIDTNLGKKIVLLNYDYQLNSWWNRVYDATPKVFGL